MLYIYVKRTRHFGGVFNETVIPLALVGYEMIAGNSAPRWLSIVSYATSASEIIVKYIKVQ